MNCPACSHAKHSDHAEVSGVVVCSSCGAHYTTRAIYKGESYRVVLPFFTEDPAADERHAYYDFEVLGSDGRTRRHGWFDPQSKKITQVG